MDNQLIDKFILFEENNELFKIKIDDKNIWPIIRVNLYSQIYKNTFKTQINHPKKKITSSILLILKSLIKSIQKSPFFLKQKDTIIFNHPRRVQNENGYYECKYTEHLSNSNTYVFEIPFLGTHFNPVKTENLIYLDLIYNLSRIFSYLYTNKKLQTTEKEIINNLKNQIKNEFNIIIPNFENVIVKALIKHKALSFWAKKILKSVNPSEIITTIAYSDSIMPFVEQAKKMNIKVIEQQHGIMGQTHVAYNFLKKEEFSWYPDEIWVWNSFWANNTRFPIPSNKIIVKGFPFLDKYKKISRSKTKKKQILIISQGPFSDRLIALAIKLQSVINNDLYQIVFKPHPSEFATNGNKFIELNKLNILVLNDINIYEVFNESEYQIGVNSTALFEGMDFNLKTFIYKTTGWEVFKNAENVIFIDNEMDIVNNL